MQQPQSDFTAAIAQALPLGWLCAVGLWPWVPSANGAVWHSPTEPPEPTRPGPPPGCGDPKNWAGGWMEVGDTLTLRSLWTTPIW